jgi:hypothetical protein
VRSFDKNEGRPLVVGPGLRHPSCARCAWPPSDTDSVSTYDRHHQSGHLSKVSETVWPEGSTGYAGGVDESGNVIPPEPWYHPSLRALVPGLTN